MHRRAGTRHEHVLAPEARRATKLYALAIGEHATILLLELPLLYLLVDEEAAQGSSGCNGYYFPLLTEDGEWVPDDTRSATSTELMCVDEAGAPNTALADFERTYLLMLETIDEALTWPISRFRPPTKFNIDMLDCASEAFRQEPEVDGDRVVVLSEMTLHNLRDGGDIEVEDFLHRIEILCALGKNVLISNFGEYYRLAGYLFENTNQPIGLVMGIPSMTEIFNENYYEDLGGGILESFGRLFKNDLRLYVCPCLDDARTSLITVDSFVPPENLKHLYAYLRDNRFIRGLDTVNREYLDIFSTDVLSKIRRGESDWETMVPEQVAKMIRERRLFGCDHRC